MVSSMNKLLLFLINVITLHFVYSVEINHIKYDFKSSTNNDLLYSGYSSIKKYIGDLNSV